MQVRSPSPLPEHSYATAASAMVSTSHPLATEAALDMLAQGGSAADAYIAAAAVQVVVEPPMTTFSGGLGMNWFDAASGTHHVYGGTFGRPSAEDGDWDEEGIDSGRTACVPGWLVGARTALEAKGRLPWARHFDAACKYADEGFAIDDTLWGWVFEYHHKLARFREGQAIWYPEGHLLNPGDELKQTALAESIHRIQDDPDLEWFYRGDFAQKYVARVQADGGRLTLDDMARGPDTGMAAEVASIGRYRGYDIHSPGAFIVALAMAAVEHGDLRSYGPPVENPETLYLQMRLIEEIWHEGLSVRPEDTAHVFASTGTVDEALVERKAEDLWRRVVNEPSRPFDALNPGTNAITIIDKDGNVAYGTHSCSCVPFGNGHIVDGIWVSRPILVYGQPAPLPLGLTTALLLMRDGKPALAVGSPSISCVHNVLQNTFNVVEFGMTLRESVQQPMFGSPLYPSRRSMVEGDFSEETFTYLREKGMQFNRVSPLECERGSCQGILVNEQSGEIEGVADPRRRGMAKGI